MQSVLKLALALILASVAAAQQKPAAGTGRVLPEYDAPGVVLLALGNPADDDSLTRLLIGDVPRPLARIQVEIALKAAKKNPVVILAPDDDAKFRFLEHCDDHPGLCRALDDGRIRVAAVPHRTEWIRDYGPMFRTTANGPVMLDAAYHDLRNDIDKREKLAEINRKRLDVLMELTGGSVDQLMRDRKRSAEPPAADDESSEPEPSPAATDDEAEEESEIEEQPEGEEEEFSEEEVRAAIQALFGGADKASSDDDAQLKLGQLYGQLYEALEKYGDERALDDEAPGAIVLSLFSKPDVPVDPPAIDLDGGNMLPMPDGQCLTTRDLLARNAGKQAGAREILMSKYGCKDVIFLEALPGGVIEHVDMFVLPAGDDRVFIASYDPSDPLLKNYWSELSASMKRIILEAAVTMANNARILRAEGYEVIDVPSPFPREGMRGLYYPTVLNGLIQTGDDRKRHFLLPRYDDYQVDVQDQAFALIRKTLGPQVEVDTVESTLAASAQGAVHCLTLVVPRQWTHFGDLQHMALRDLVEKHARALDASSNTGRAGALDGTWHFDGFESEEFDAIDIEPTIVFRHDKIRYKLGEITRRSTEYQVVEKTGNRWKLKLGDGSNLEIAWHDPNSIEIIDTDESKKVALVRK